MKKSYIFLCLCAFSTLALAGDGADKNQYKEKLQVWFDDLANQAKVLKNDNK